MNDNVNSVKNNNDNNQKDIVDMTRKLKVEINNLNSKIDELWDLSNDIYHLIDNNYRDGVSRDGVSIDKDNRDANQSLINSMENISYLIWDMQQCIKEGLSSNMEYISRILPPLQEDDVSEDGVSRDGVSRDGVSIDKDNRDANQSLINNIHSYSIWDDVEKED